MACRPWAIAVLAIAASFAPSRQASGADDALRARAATALRRAAEFYRGRVASHGGYVYYYTPDLRRRWGEGEATADQIWVQPPGSPTVGLAYLKAYEATRDPFYLAAAREAAEALAYGQLASGGWTNCIDFDPRGERVARYRNGRGRGRDDSTLDDGISQAAIRLLMHADRALEFRAGPIHEAARVALDALLAAQFPNGGFPQVWSRPVSPQPSVAARYPRHDWRTEGRVKNYWDMYTLNDGVAGTVSRTLQEAYEIYGDGRCLKAVSRLGDFLLLAQMPAPQPAWAQQYNYQMEPIWARRFEPAAVSGAESQDVLDALLRVYRLTKDPRYLEPIPRALDYLGRSLLPDGRLARYYELQTNRPLYMSRRGDDYTPTYDDSDLPGHYGWKWESRLGEIRREYDALKAGGGSRPSPAPDLGELEGRVRKIVDDLDDQGRWLSTATGERLMGQLKLPPGARYISSSTFSENLEALSAYLAATAPR